MSDSDNFSRPSKRRRRDSISPPPPKSQLGTNHRGERRYRDKSPRSEDRRRTRSPDRTYTSRDRETQRSIRSQSEESENYKSERRRRRSGSTSRSKSREWKHDRHGNSHSHRRRDRSSSPRSSRHRHRDRETGRDKDRTRERNRNKTTHRAHSRSRTTNHHHPSHSPPALPPSKSKTALPSQTAAFSATTTADTTLTAVPKQKPNFNPTGKLAAASNTIQTANQTIILKYHEPPESRKPPSKDAWRLYIFKGAEILDTVELSEQSCWLFGREAAVADVPVEHPSCSKQHAAIQFRYLERRSEFGDRTGRVRPYVIDLESANGTMLNGEVVPNAKYVELRDGDVLKFGESMREYVIQLPLAK